MTKTWKLGDFKVLDKTALVAISKKMQNWDRRHNIRGQPEIKKI